jgi:hypothetical protein
MRLSRLGIFDVARTFVLSGSLLAITSQSLWAQTIAQSAQPNPASANVIRPRKVEITSIRLADGRDIKIHEEDTTTSANTGRVFFHKPIFAFEDNPNATQGSPAIFWDKEDLDGATFVQVKLVLTTPEIQELARIAVAEKYKASQNSNTGTTPNSIAIEPWPIKLLRLDAKHAVTGEIFGTTISSDSLSSAGNTASISIKVPSDKYVRFVELVTADRIIFVPSYTYENAIVAFGSNSTQVSSKVVQSVADVLNSEQVKPGAPIFQENTSRIEGKLQQTILSTIQATDPQIMAHIPALSISSYVLQPQTVTFESMQNNRPLLDAVKQYLQAAIDKVTKERKESQKAENTQESNKTQKLGAGYGVTGPSVNADITQEEKSRLTQTHGIDFTESSDKSILDPHSIRISYLRDSWQTNFVSVFQSAYLAVGVSNSLEQDSGFRPSFTREKLNNSLSSMSLVAAPFSGIQNGMSFCSFTAEVPKGFVLLDGIGHFPDEQWVPQHLRGKNVPNMAGVFARGAANVNDIAKAHGGPTITVPGDTIQSGAFSLGSSRDIGVMKAFPNGPDLVLGAPATDANGRPIGAMSGSVVIGTQVNTESFRNNLRFFDAQISVSSVHLYDSVLGQATTPDKHIDLSREESQPANVSCQWIMRMDKQ